MPAPSEKLNLKDGDSCEVVKGTHAGKSGVIRDINTSKTGHITITVVQKSGARFKTLGRNVSVIKSARKTIVKKVQSKTSAVAPKEYADDFSKEEKSICNSLYALINSALPKAENKIWHGHPVWFLNENPIVGYSKLKDSIRLLFWSGQSFNEPGLKPEGTFKAAEARYTTAAQIVPKDVIRWLKKSQTIQWDYKNLVKRKGKLEKL